MWQDEDASKGHMLTFLKFVTICLRDSCALLLAITTFKIVKLPSLSSLKFLVYCVIYLFLSFLWLMDNRKKNGNGNGRPGKLVL